MIAPRSEAHAGTQPAATGFVFWPGRTSLVGILLERNWEFSLFFCFLPDIDRSWREGWRREGGKEGGMWSGDKLEEEEGKEFNEGSVRLARRGAESEEGARLLDPSAADVHSLHFLLLFDLGQTPPPH